MGGGPNPPCGDPVAGFIDVVLRGLILCGMAVTLGGVAFALVVIRPAARRRPELSGVQGRTLAFAAIGAAIVGLAQLGALLVQLVTLADGGPWPVADASETLFFRVSLIRMAVALAVIAAALALRRAPDQTRRAALLAGLALALGLLAPGTRHAAGRIEGRLPLFLLDALHQVAAFVWVGGLFHLVVTALSPRLTAWPGILLPRFSALALAAVAALIASGAALSVAYIDALTAMTGT